MRFAKSRFKPRALERKHELRIGYVPGWESALLILARELGCFDRHGLKVALRREIGWATVREKITHEELDAAVTPSSMLFSIYAGLRGVRRACLTALWLGQTVNAIILSQALRDWGVHDASSLASLIRRHRGRRTFGFGIPLALSSQHAELYEWLRRFDLDPDKDVELSILPSTLIHESIRQGYLNGFIAPAPASIRAVQEGSGWVVATARDLGGAKHDSVLLVLQEFAEARDDEHVRLVASLIEASAFAQEASHRDEVIRCLTSSGHVSDALSALKSVQHLAAPGEASLGSLLAAFAPCRSAGKEAVRQLQALTTELPPNLARSESLAKICREDIYHRAQRLAQPGLNAPPESRFIAPERDSAGEPSASDSDGALETRSLLRTWGHALGSTEAASACAAISR